MYKTNYFTIRELIYSSTAAQKGIDNTPPAGVKVRLSILINSCLNPIREAWGKPIYINSGYRCPYLNRIVGGVPTSQHTQGEAADITTGNATDNKKLFDLILEKGFAFDQLIDEKDYQWLHISYRSSGNRKNVLHL